MPLIYEPNEDDLYGENGIFRNIFVNPAARALKAERTKGRSERNRERTKKNRERTSRRRRDNVYESASDLSDSSGDRSHIAKVRPGTGRQSENLRIDGDYPV